MSSWFFESLLVCSVIITVTNGNIELKIDRQNTFPYPADKSFSIRVVCKEPNGTVNNYVTDTMVVIIRTNDGKNRELDRAIFDYGFKDAIDMAYKGDYITIPYWSKANNHESINIQVLFSRQANNQWLELYHLPAKTQIERRQMLENLTTFKEVRQLMRKRVSLLVPPRLELTIRSPDGRKDELMSGQKGRISCVSRDGIPPLPPRFMGLEDLDVEQSDVDTPKVVNELTVSFLVSLFDHQKRVWCKAGESEESRTILVLHHASQVILEPEPGLFLSNGTTVTCLKANGYPPPTIRWSLVRGPPNASRFITITHIDGAKFTLHNDTPLHSRWTINCTAYNIIPGSTLTYNRTITFTIGRPREGLLAGLNLVTQLIVGVVIIAAIVLFCAIIVTFVCIVRRCMIGPSATGTNTRKNGVTNKIVVKEKGLESEQVILLPPGAPVNYVDMSNCESGLPPPPPEYELMIDGVSKSPQSSEKRQDNRRLPKYNEVTYAELNTSNMPMKNSPLSQLSSGSDDQVIYSQIVGTVINPYTTQRSYSESNNV